jgi:hypothetical protein
VRRTKALFKLPRYKGRASLKLIESKFPYHVDMIVLEGGFGARLNAMHKWHDAHGIPAVSGGRRVESRDIVRWFFADSEMAALFGKKLLLSADRLQSSSWVLNTLASTKPMLAPKDSSETDIKNVMAAP